MAIRNILRPLGIVYGIWCSLWQFVCFVVFWYIFPVLVCWTKKSVNPCLLTRRQLKAQRLRQCDQIGRNFAIWALFFGVGRIFFSDISSPKMHLNKAYILVFFCI
jgi:hypothetical protein